MDGGNHLGPPKGGLRIHVGRAFGPVAVWPLRAVAETEGFEPSVP